MLKVIIALVATGVLAGIGLKKNCEFRFHAEKVLPASFVKFILKTSGMCGLGLLPLPLLLAFGVTGVAKILLLLAAVDLVVLLLATLKNKLPLWPWLLEFVLIGVGDMTRSVLKFTIVGIPIVNHADFIAREGYQAYMEAVSRQAENSKPTPSLRDALHEMDAAMDESRAANTFPQDTAPNVKVWRKNGMMNENLKVSSDGQRYFDPEDGQWHKVP